MNFMRNKLSAGISLALVSASFNLTAQQSMPDAESADDELEIIQVTSRKRIEPLNKVPVAVSAFTDEMLEQQGLQSIDDIARFSPGLSFSKAFGRSTERPVIRGLGNVLAGVQFGVESGAAYFVDGTYFAGDILSLDLADIARVEVVKGPQSALYGRNSYSGAINFITKGPDHAEVTGRIKASFAQDSEHTVSGYLTGPLNDWLAASISIRDYSTDGQWTNTVTNQEIGDESTTSYSIVFDAEPNEQLNMRLRIQGQDDEDGTRPFALQPSTENNCMPGYRSLASWAAAGVANNNQYYCGELQLFPIALNDGPDADGVPNPVPGVPVQGFLPAGPVFFGNAYDTADGTAFDGVERDLMTAIFTLDYETKSEHSLHLATSYRDDDIKTGSDSDHSSVNYTFFPGSEGFFAISGRSEVKDKSVEFNIRSPLGKFQWMLGAFYFDQEDKGYDLTFADPDNGLFDSESTVTNKAIYASMDYSFNDKLEGTLEARWAEEEKGVREFDTADGSVTFDREGSWNNFTPRITLNYQYSDDTIVFGIAGKGVKPGGFNGAAGADAGFPTYEQEESLAYELGVKTTLSDSIYTTLSMFYNDVTDVQLTTPVANPSGALSSVATNQGEGKVIGLEIDVNVSFSDNLTGRFSYALADSEFTKGCDDFQWSLTSGGGLLAPGTESGTDYRADFGINDPASCSIKGNQFPLSSKHQASAFIEYTQELSDGMEFFSSLDLSYESKKYVQVHNLASVPEATILGARIGIDGENWRLSAFARNLTDEDAPVMATRWLQIPYFSFSSLNVAPDGADKGSPRAFFVTPRRGRQIGIEFTYHF